jgi:20S proteasome alpha/beta subunit
VTLIVALQGEDDLVFASDTLVWEGVKEGYYTSQVSKLRVVGQDWVSGSAGTGVGADVQAQIAAAQEGFDPDVDAGAPAYALRTKELYRKSQYVGDTSFLLGGFGQHGPAIYRWGLPGFCGPMRSRSGRCAIGIGEHGAMYLAAAYHQASMTTEQRMLLAYFCVYEVTKHDPRVGTPIELAVARPGEVKIFTGTQLARFQRESEALTNYIADRFSTQGLERDPLLVP